MLDARSKINKKFSNPAITSAASLYWQKSKEKAGTDRLENSRRFRSFFALVQQPVKFGGGFGVTFFKKGNNHQLTTNQNFLILIESCRKAERTDALLR